MFFKPFECIQESHFAHWLEGVLRGGKTQQFSTCSGKYDELVYLICRQKLENLNQATLGGPTRPHGPHRGTALGFQQLRAFLQPHSPAQREQPLSSISFVFFPVLVPVTATLRKVTMASQPTKCCFRENQTVSALFLKTQKGDSDSYFKKETTERAFIETT